jgi:hypothetical protein
MHGMVVYLNCQWLNSECLKHRKRKNVILTLVEVPTSIFIFEHNSFMLRMFGMLAFFKFQ